MTIEAWINPTALGNTWRTVALKEQPGYYAYGLYASTGAGTSVPSGNGMIGAVDRDVRGTAQLPLNTWTHLATTYDGSALRLYVNGTQVATLAATGSIVTSTGALKFGGNALWGEWYSGLIDELRVYNRALTPAEIQGDMTRPVTGGDTTAPSVPGVVGCGGFGGAGDVVVVGVFGQRWCAALQRASRYERGVCGFGGEPDRAAGDAGLCGSDGAGELLLQGHCRGCGREHQRGFE